MVRCAAYAAWTRPGLAMTDKRCFELTCLYQVRVFLRLHKQVTIKNGLTNLPDLVVFSAYASELNYTTTTALPSAAYSI